MLQRTAGVRVPRQRAPALELESTRIPSLGYESAEDAGFIRCLEHGYPTPLARWHFHDEYELHQIVATSGKAFVGDWIGQFEPGHLVLVGPRVPHNWISLDVPDDGVALRDLVIQFPHAPMLQLAQSIPEFGEMLPLLERARYGIEFFGLSDQALEQFRRVRSSRGIERIGAFCSFVAVLTRCHDYRLLSTVQMQSSEDPASLDRINSIVDMVSADPASAPAMSACATRLGMSESAFSRLFHRATGNTFTDFVNRVRINRACQLLMDSDRYVTNICYEVGFNNVANFNRRFLAFKGMTPTEFRRQAGGRFGAGR